MPVKVYLGKRVAREARELASSRQLELQRCNSGVARVSHGCSTGLCMSSLVRGPRNRWETAEHSGQSQNEDNFHHGVSLDESSLIKSSMDITLLSCAMGLLNPYHFQWKRSGLGNHRTVWVGKDLKAYCAMTRKPSTSPGWSETHPTCLEHSQGCEGHNLSGQHYAMLLVSLVGRRVVVPFIPLISSCPRYFGD